MVYTGGSILYIYAIYGLLSTIFNRLYSEPIALGKTLPTVPSVSPAKKCWCSIIVVSPQSSFILFYP